MEPERKIEVTVREVDATKLEKGGVYLVAVSENHMTGQNMERMRQRLEALGVSVVVAPVVADDVSKAIKVMTVPKKENE